VCYLLFLKYGLLVFLPTFKDKEPINFIRLYSGGSVWRSEAVFGTVVLCNAIVNRALLCIVNFINGFMQKHLDKMDTKQNGIEPFSLLHLIRPVGRIFVFIGTRQVVF